MDKATKATAGKVEAREEKSDDEAEVNIEQRVAAFTQAVAPVLLPIIESLGALDESDLPSVVTSGEAT